MINIFQEIGFVFNDLKILLKKKKMQMNCIFSSPEHFVLWVSYCDSAVSIVRRQLFALCTL